MRATNRWISTLAIALPLLGLGPRGEPPASTPFTREVVAHFNNWDANSDGILAPDEIDRLITDPNIKDRPAAALGALKLGQRSTKITMPPVTRDYLHEYEAQVAEKKKPAPNFDRYFARAMRRILSPSREVLFERAPSLESFHQGPIGDCYFLSVIGGAVVRDWASVAQMFTSREDGTIEVKFGDGRRAEVPALTDAELALTSTAGSEGLWLSVLEKAYGTIRTDALPEEKQRESATDAIAHGGTAGTTIRLVTGHDVERIGLRPRPLKRTNSKKNDPEAQKGTVPTQPTELAPEQEARLSAHLEQALPALRAHLVSSLAEHRLIAAGTPKDVPMPPGVNQNHSYAVLGYDPSSDMITLWNPHGNTFKPKGEPGLENGYPTKKGEFSMPLEQFARVFNGIFFETSRELPKMERAAPAASMQP